MPAFDPVRDAVLNSPVTQTKPLPFRLDLPANSFPNPSPGSSGSDSAISAPSPITRRATDLSVLLNDDPPDSAHSQSLFTPTTPRTPSSFSHLLHPDEHSPNINEQLAHAAPIRRRSSVVEREGSSREGGSTSYFPTTRSPLAFPGNVQDVRRHSVPSPYTGHGVHGYPQPPASPGLAFPGLTHSSRSRPSTANSATSDHSVTEISSDQQAPVNASRRRSSGASDGSRERDGSFSYFTPATRSPLALASQVPTEHQPQSSPSPHTRSPLSPFAVLNNAGVTQLPPPSSPSPASRPSTSDSATGPRPVSPTTAKRADRKPPSSAQMPPPPVPTPALATPQSQLPTKSKPQTFQTGTTTTTTTTAPSKPPLTQTNYSAAASMFPRSNVPYAPKNRITPPSSVLVPLSAAELERYRNYNGGTGSQLLRRLKRKRDLGGDHDAYPTKRNRDVGLIAGHYNARPEVGLQQRKDSPIIGLKNFNNWVKSVLITREAHGVLAASENSGPLKQLTGPKGMRGPSKGAGKVLDIGCGKGGDLIKWNKAKIREYVGLDIAAVSIDQARKRYDELRMPKFNAYFTAADCYSQSLTAALPESVLPPMGAPFDVVSMQFCMHYAFESEQKARTMIENVSNWLRPGGRFIGTIPNANWLLERLDAIPPHARELSFGNNVYSIRFDEREHRSLYGHRYWFFLKDAVDDVPEYIVHWDSFVKLADEYGLTPVYVKEFHEVYAENEDHHEFGPLLQNMRVVDSNGESQMDEDQWEAANIYIAFAFEKRSR